MPDVHTSAVGTASREHDPDSRQDVEINLGTTSPPRFASLAAPRRPRWRVLVRGIGKHRHACASDRARPRALSLFFSLFLAISLSPSHPRSRRPTLPHAFAILSSSLFCFVLPRGTRDARGNSDSPLGSERHVLA